MILGGNGQSLIVSRAKAGVIPARCLDPHGLDGSDEPDAIVVSWIVDHGWRPSLQGAHVERSVFLSVAVRNGALKGRRGWAVGTCICRRWNVQILLTGEWRRQDQRADGRMGRRSRCVQHRHLLGAVAESRVPVWHV